MIQLQLSLHSLCTMNQKGSLDYPIYSSLLLIRNYCLQDRYNSHSSPIYSLTISYPLIVTAINKSLWLWYSVTTLPLPAMNILNGWFTNTILLVSPLFLYTLISNIKSIILEFLTLDSPFMEWNLRKIILTVLSYSIFKLHFIWKLILILSPSFLQNGVGGWRVGREDAYYAELHFTTTT